MPFTAFTSDHWAAFVIMMGFIGFFNIVSVSAIQAFVGFRFADRRGELFNVIDVANNIGVASARLLSCDTRLYLFVGLGSLFLWFGNSVWNTGVSPFIIKQDLPKAMYGLLWTLNGILILLYSRLFSG